MQRKQRFSVARCLPQCEQLLIASASRVTQKTFMDRQNSVTNLKDPSHAADPDYWKGEVFAYVGLPQNLKDLKDQRT